MVVPKFHYGDIVRFQDNSKEYYGQIEIVDEYGSFWSTANTPTYDILVERENTLFKHVDEKNLRLIAKVNTVAEKAFLFAEQAHAGKKDLAGVDYIWHLIEVSEIVREKIVDDIIIATALLHDILEDTEINERFLSAKFPREIVNAVRALTRESDETYDCYLNKVKKNRISRIVKLADLQHNADISRIMNPTNKEFQRLEKYQKAILFLKDK